MILKKIDSVGRIVIPAEIRNSLNWKINDEIELNIKDNVLEMKKHQQSHQCIICSSIQNLIKIDNFLICKNCKDKIINNK